MDEIICSLCNEKMDKPEWEWGEEDAHKECVINVAETKCSKKCGYLSILGEEHCRECGSEMEMLTDEDKEKLLKGDS